MPNTMRVKLEPNPVPQEGSRYFVAGVRLELTQLGAGLTNAVRDTPVPATLTFHATFLNVARGNPERTPELFATIEGQLELRGAELKPVFINGRDESQIPNAIVYEDPEPEPDPDADPDVDPPLPRRVLELEFDSASFQDMLDPGLTNSRLVLPSEADTDFLYLEIGTELEVAGTVEAPLETNDTLDVPLFNREFIRVRVTNVQGEPAAGIPFSITTRDGAVVRGLLDTQGRMAMFGLPPGDCEFVLEDESEEDLFFEDDVAATATA